MAPATSFAALIAGHLSARRSVLLCTVVRTASPSHVPAGAKVVCPVGESPRVYGLADAEAEQLIKSLPIAEPPAKPQLREVELRLADQTISLSVYVELVSPPLQLVIAGAGHIARPLAEIAAALGWNLVAVDDRPDYAAPEYFPSGTKVICAQFDQAWRQIEVDEATAIVLVTRGHKHDQDCLRALVNTRPFYIGMIGSKRRVRTTIDGLESDGVSHEFTSRIFAPVGLPIGTDTPGEIAVAIAAEIVAVRRGRDAWAKTEKDKFYRLR